MSSLIVAGVGMAVVGYGVRYALRKFPQVINKFKPENFATMHYYRGGFEQKMTKREAALILGLPPNPQAHRVRAAYKTLMVKNHPDRGGSPYLSAKISEAKDLLDK